MPESASPIMVSSTSLIISGSSAEVGSSNSMICGSMVDEPVYNDLNDKIGSIDDVIVSPDRQATFAVVSVGGFLGMGKHYVAIPIDHFEIRDGNLFLAGATKEALKSVPSFECNRLEKATKPRKVKAE
ncbi:PRC-barrel domain-containing protein [Paraburkholderia strydomiana]|jgi:hypothetical protein